MELLLNNRNERIDTDSDEVSVQQIIELKNFTFPRVIVKLNGQLIKKPDYANTLVKDGDRLEVIHLISGG